MLGIKNKKVKELLNSYKEISVLQKTLALLSWDLNVNLPASAGEERALQIAYITKLLTDRWLNGKFRDVLDRAVNKKEKFTQEEKAVIRNLKQAGKYYFKVPKEIITEFAETTSRSFLAWQEAKLNNNFGDFLPHLKKVIRLNQIIAQHLGYEDNPYDALLDMYEPGLTTSKMKRIFSLLKPELLELLERIKKSKTYKQKDGLKQEDYPVDDQKQLALFILRRIGYDMNSGRMDVSSHPFTESLGRFDVRITNRYSTSDFIESMMVALHEGGHALYEQGIKKEYSQTPLEGGVSLGVHESQSRFWENQIGRSYEFIRFVTPILHAFYPQQLMDFGSETFFKRVVRVRPGLIRTQADEITYNLHIAIRFELEDGLINERIDPEDLPNIWNKLMKKYLGVVPTSDSEGVLQDVHWSYGSFGYFPTYTLGNLYAAQFANSIRREIDIEKLCEKGDFGPILSWLRTNIHQHGSLYWPDELVRKVTGEQLNAKYFLAYVKEKYKRVYSL
jgi:carboxypeptidase Taq